MRQLTPKLTKNLEMHFGKKPSQAKPYLVRTYRKLVELVAGLAFKNEDQLLFFRGQNADYKNKAGSSSLYPSIYRGDNVEREEINLRFERLESAASQLKEIFVREKVEGHHDVKKRKYIRWSLLQHYEVCETPLLDFTHSLRVACSFAQLNNDGKFAYIYVFGFPYFTNRISTNSEDDLVNVRLLSICPPNALRPYFQDGYLAGTDEVTTDYDRKSELDFSRRLVGKFSIPNSKAFWGRNFISIPNEYLYPKSDRIEQLCKSITPTLTEKSRPRRSGEFLDAWIKLERLLVELTAEETGRVPSAYRAIRKLQDSGYLSAQDAAELNEIRTIRNRMVHGIGDLELYKLDEAIVKTNGYWDALWEFRASRN